MYVSLSAITIHPHGNHANETTRSRYMPKQARSQPAVSERILFTPSPARLLISSSKKYSKDIEEMSWGTPVLTSGSY